MSSLVRLVAAQVLGCHEFAHLAAGGKPQAMHVVSTQPGHMSPELWFRSDAKGVHVERSIHGTGTVRWTQIAALVHPALTVPDVAAAIAHGCEAWGRYCWGADRRLGRASDSQQAWEHQLRTVGEQAMRAAADAVWAEVDGATVRQLDLFGETA